MELFSTLDNALSQKAQDTLTEFAAVKKADVQLQTQLGNRKGQIAANVIGAFAESQNSAFGWQVRAFGGKDNIGGANVGVFLRRVESGLLYGINVFADYENGKYGDFLRYGIGGELQNRYGSLAANYYTPITDDKRKGATVMFSQEGYDFNLRLNIPQLDFLKVRTDYYNYHGKYGGGNDKGLRYGLEVQPISDLRIGVFYDDGGEKFGGDIVYVYNFGNRQLSQKRESTADFSPDLFSPVVREYSQRIVITTTERIEVLTTAMTINTGTMITPERVFTTAMTMAGMTTILTTETPTMTITRMASVHFLSRVNIIFNTTLFYSLISTEIKQLLTLPAASQSTPPIVITTTTNFDTGAGAGEAVIVSTDLPARINVPGGNYNFDADDEVYTLTIVEGSEEFISVAITLTTENTTTVPHIITETPMTIAAMTITTRLTTFATSTITIGANIGAAKVDSHLPPSFPPPIFPPSSPIMVSYGLAKNGDSWIPAMVIPTLAPFPRHSRLRGNDEEGHSRLRGNNKLQPAGNIRRKITQHASRTGALE